MQRINFQISNVDKLYQHFLMRWSEYVVILCYPNVKQGELIVSNDANTLSECHNKEMAFVLKENFRIFNREQFELYSYNWRVF